MWPVLIESTLSVVWAYTFVLLTSVWLVSSAFGIAPVGASPIPNWWGMTIATLSLVQLGTGVAMDRRYDGTVARYFSFAVFYPIVYWLLMAVITVVTTPKGLMNRSSGPARWRTSRAPSEPEQGPVPAALARVLVDSFD